ncbi:MAG: hypothetical protein WA151_00870 [Desulfatirhabdiaceae bacterium]
MRYLSGMTDNFSRRQPQKAYPLPAAYPKPLSWFQNAPFWPISALGENFNPRNIPYIPPVEIFIRLDLYQTETF